MDSLYYNCMEERERKEREETPTYARSTVELLADLLDASRRAAEGGDKFADDLQDDSQQSTPNMTYATPGHIGAGGPPSVAPASSVKLEPKKEEEEKKSKKKDIWDEDEVESQEAYFEDESDERERPTYDVLYKQSVSAMDAYLGIDPEKNPSSLACDQLLVKIQLPKQNDLSSLTLDVTRQYLQLRSPIYKLILPLPKPVKDKETKAKWDPKLKVLSVTLPIAFE